MGPWGNQNEIKRDRVLLVFPTDPWMILGRPVSSGRGHALFVSRTRGAGQSSAKSDHVVITSVVCTRKREGGREQRINMKYDRIDMVHL